MSEDPVDADLAAFLELSSGASSMKSIFDAMLAAGFDEDTAVKILVKMWVELVKDENDPG